MDLLFSEYASPFLLLDGVVATGRLEEFFDTFKQQKKERLRWEFYINKVPPWDNMSWDEFNENLDAQSNVKIIPPEQIGTTITNSFSVLNGFIPNGKGDI